MSPSSESVWELQGWEPGLCYPGEGLEMGPGQLGSIHQAAEGLFSLFLFNSIQFSNLFHPGKQWRGEGQGRGECVHSHH